MKNRIIESISLLNYTETAVKQRTCKSCLCKIKAKEKHFVIYRTGSGIHWWPIRENFCLFCIKGVYPILSNSIKGSIKQRKLERDAELFVKEL